MVWGFGGFSEATNWFEINEGLTGGIQLPLRQAGTLRRRPPVDPGDAEALRRRVRALQKKLREIEKLKVSWTCWKSRFSFFPLHLWFDDEFGFMKIILFWGGNSLKMFPSTISVFWSVWSWEMIAILDGCFGLVVTGVLPLGR